MTEQEPSLPTLPPNSRQASTPFNFRKRTHLPSLAMSQSSDPPTFSSDDDPSLDNYTNVRRRKLYRGPWYDQKLVNGQEKPKRELQRQWDSGIWMGSDDTDMVEAEPKPKESERSDVERPAPMKAWAAADPSPEDFAEKYIERCLDDGAESINLMGCDLKTLSDRAIQLLSTFAYVHPTPGFYQPLAPKLQLLLSTNNIVRVPGEIFTIQHLHVLTLRANKIQELPPAISQLRNLVELNVANNSLRSLPFEILELLTADSSLREFHFHPNPFYEPDLPAVSNAEGNTRPAIPRALTMKAECRGNWRTAYRFSSPARHFHANGKLAQGPYFAEESGQVEETSSMKIPVSHTPSRNVTASAAPSLFELCLRTCSDSPELPYLADLEHAGMPAYFPPLFRKVLHLKEAGGRNCTTCGRPFVLARVEWIEWWEIQKGPTGPAPAASSSRRGADPGGRDQIEAIVPLMRRGCSLKCYRPTEAGI